MYFWIFRLSEIIFLRLIIFYFIIIWISYEIFDIAAMFHHMHAHNFAYDAHT